MNNHGKIYHDNSDSAPHYKSSRNLEFPEKLTGFGSEKNIFR